ncbi:hypothetical protein BX600DRAFT_514616 [Xylariales sp. PMI_506]|nr:hypothetical protein BX600DRAFT_514616 [Xylariales sp. PMI_506]
MSAESEKSAFYLASNPKGFTNQLESEDTALLFLCMYLAVLSEDDVEPKGSMFSPLYRAIKRAFASLACLSRPTMELIQSGMLITLFEFGHGRSRFAYRTLSETLAMARTAGIKPVVWTPNDTAASSQTEEDKQAIWWGLFILDQQTWRYIHLDPAANDLPLMIQSPRENYLLPTKAATWDGQSYTVYENRYPVNVPIMTHLGTFQRAAQAATVLNRAHLWRDVAREQTAVPHVAEFEALDREIRSVLSALIAQCHRFEVFCDAFAMCMGSLFVLYQPYVLPNSDTSPRMEQCLDASDVEKATTAINFAISFIKDLSVDFNEHLHQHPSWLANLAPPATIACCQSLQIIVASEDSLGSDSAGFSQIYKSLKTFSMRWKVGEVTLNSMSQYFNLNEWIANVENVS